MKFADYLKLLPSVASLHSLSLIDDEGNTVAVLENKAGQAGSLAVYHHLFQIFGAMTPEAAEKGLILYSEHTEDARQYPQKHPNIDRLFKLIDQNITLDVELVYIQ
jgi:hypothetical protein